MEGSSQGETSEVRTVIRIKQGRHCPLHPQVKPKTTRKGDVNGSFLDKLRPGVEAFYCLLYGPLPVKEPIYDTAGLLARHQFWLRWPMAEVNPCNLISDELLNMCLTE